MRRLRVDRRLGLLLGGVTLLTFLALGASVALPASDPDLRAPGEPPPPLEARGMEVYRNEGCWYCHTQFVRTTPVDGHYGDPLDADAYAGLSPAMLGSERIGPDLARAGTRFADEQALIAFLRDPAGADRRTSMPAYAHLSPDDLRALAAYLLSLR